MLRRGVREQEGTGSRRESGRTDDAVPAGNVSRQHAAYGGIKWGAAFFGWLSAHGLAVLLISLAAAAGTAFGLTRIDDAGDAQATAGAAAERADTIGLVGALILLAILALAYYAGGYVAGRMARFDGVRQGVAVWVVGLLITVLLVVLGLIAGAEYNVAQRLDLPTIPLDAGTLTTGGLITLGAVLVGTLLAAIAGGKAGERYHRKVDRAGLAD